MTLRLYTSLLWSAVKIVIHSDFTRRHWTVILIHITELQLYI